MKTTPSHEEQSQLAYRFWQERGCPLGSPEVDWQRAEEELARAGQPEQTDAPPAPRKQLQTSDATA
jgi:hypothetical protein